MHISRIGNVNSKALEPWSTVRNALSTTEKAKMTLSRSRDGQNSKTFELGFTMWKALSTIDNARMTLSRLFRTGRCKSSEAAMQNVSYHRDAARMTLSMISTLRFFV